MKRKIKRPVAASVASVLTTWLIAGHPLPHPAGRPPGRADVVDKVGIQSWLSRTMMQNNQQLLSGYQKATHP